MDFYETQNKYRQKQFKVILNSLFKVILFIFIFLTGWWFGNSDKLILIQENDKIISEFNQKKISIERQLAETRLKLKEANSALTRENINNNSDFGRDAKNTLASALAQGVSEKMIVNTLKLLSPNKVCGQISYEELAVSTQSFSPPKNVLLLFSGSLKIKAEGNINNVAKDNPYFNPTEPLRIIFKYLGNNDMIEGNLPITKDIITGKFAVKIKILKSKVRGAVVVNYQSCKI